ncbi:hypothetical protein [Actinoplanes palleronii]|uniref:Integral membrane protein n=1 Tax=Actinoplanes palleronii TaxID=113570 RepID=A0ABQ4BI93_9ACTN|nr:hypothetical protein [Actinoplanes palleronii]GIE70382.1 hypothetical protein Apa02nite_064900 [Actinoplanes palleronii]
MASASPLVEHRSASPRARPADGTDRWRWLRALLILPLSLLLITQARRQGVVSPLLDRLDPRLVEALTALATGMFCHVLAGRLHRHGIPRLAAPFVVAGPGLAVCAAAPVAAADLPAVIGLVLVIIALGGYLRFVIDGQTLGGFVAGTTLAAAAVCDLVTLGYMAAFAAAVPFVAGAWARQVRATTAILAVLAFPSVAVYLGWLYVRWRFAGTAFGGPSHPGPAEAVDLARGAVTVLSALGHCLMYVVIGVAVGVRRRSALPAYLLPVVVLVALVAVGVPQSALVVNLFLTAVAVTAIRAPLSRREWAGLTALAAGQVVLTLTWSP